MQTNFKFVLVSCFVLCLGVEAAEEKWVSLFNGKNLDGWTVKIKGQPLGKNFQNTFRVEDGLMKVGYAGYKDFNRQFGHIFFKDSFAHYRIRVEHRFVGEQVKGGPGWALRNSGIMLHCQDPKTMGLDQDFPVSIEVQLLGGAATGKRTTANLCTPGTNVVMKGKLVTRHCFNSQSETYRGEGWVTVEVEVRGSKMIRHLIDGKEVLSYQKPQLDPRDADAKKLIRDGKLLLEGGYVSLQSESHPVEFRKVELMVLEK